jgi:hypothetical protein
MNWNAELKRLLFDRVRFAAGYIGRAIDREDFFAFADKFF